MISILEGDATAPKGEEEELKFIVHCVNDLGVWGAGFVIALSKKWGHLKSSYQTWISEKKGPLGEVLYVRVETDIIVANLCGQTGVGLDSEGKPPVRYEAIRQGFSKINHLAEATHASVHMPRIACGLAGGSWAKIEQILEEEFPDVPVFIYDWKQGSYNL